MTLLLLMGGASGGGGGGGGGAQSSGFFGTRPPKTVLYAIYDSLAGVGGFSGTANLLGWWYDPTSKVGFSTTMTGGTSDLQVTLPRQYGAMGEPYESSGMDVTVALGYRVDVYIADRDTLVGTDASTWGKLIYRGTIEDYESTLNSVTITVSHIGRLARTSPIKGTYAIGGGSGGAQALIVAYLTGLTWDPTNTSSSVDTVGNPQPQGPESIYVADALNKIVEAAGADYYWFVRAAGLLAFGKQSRSGTPTSGTARHILTVGGEIIGEPKIGKSQIERKTEIALYWNDAGVMTQVIKQGATYDVRDPKTLIVNRQDITDATAADRAADNYLAQLDRPRYRVQVVVSDATYDIESFNVADVVRVVVPRLPGTNNNAGYLDINDIDLLVMGLRYDFDTVTLDLDALFYATMVQNAGASPLSTLSRELRALSARVAS